MAAIVMQVSMTHMAEMGVLTSVVAPLIAVTARSHVDRIALHAVAALPLFVLLHDGVVIGMSMFACPLVASVLLHVLLLVGAVLFWLPVLGARRRLADPARIVYLFIALPMLDLAGVYDVLAGYQNAGLAMIVTMLPAALIAVAIAWKWLLEEERAAVAA